YVINILILVPVCYAMFFGNPITTVFEDKIQPSDGLILLVGSLWLAILLSSCAGLIWPLGFAPVLLIQIVYKTTWLVAFILPLWLAGQPYPAGIAISFAGIVTFFPVFLWLAWR
ncbi:MAG: hypothetical protein AAFX96_07235, partial [Pseudomonadota bacterium]